MKSFNWVLLGLYLGLGFCAGVCTMIFVLPPAPRELHLYSPRPVVNVTIQAGTIYGDGTNDALVIDVDKDFE